MKTIIAHIQLMLRRILRSFTGAFTGGSTALPVLLIALAAAGVSLNTLQNGFVYDDTHQVLENPWIRDWRHLPNIFTTSVWDFIPGATSNYYRPMMHVIYLFAYQLFGPAPWGFHLVSIVLHIAVSLLVFLLARDLVAAPRQAGPSAALSGFLAALLFATHPIHTEVVAWIAAVPELSYSFFLLLSFSWYLRSGDGERGALSLSVASYFLAALCKEPALLLPILLVLYDLSYGRWPGKLPVFLRRYAPFLAAAGLYLVLRSWVLGGLSPFEPHIRMGFWGYVINAFPVFSQYLEKLIIPVDLNFYHVFHPIASLLEPRGIRSLLMAAAFIAAAVLSFRKDKPVFFSLSLIVVPLLPALYLPAVGMNAFSEHHLYLPSFGFVMLVAQAHSRLRQIRPLLASLLAVVMLGTAVLYASGTVKRNAVWRDEYTLYTETLKRSPDAAQIHYNLGIVLEEQGRIQEAIDAYLRAIELSPRFERPYTNLGILYAKQGRPDDALQVFRRATELGPANAEARNNLGNVLADLNRLEEAVAEYRTALGLSPSNADAHFNLGNVYARMGRVSEAVREYQKVLELAPGDAGARHRLTELIMRQQAGSR